MKRNTKITIIIIIFSILLLSCSFNNNFIKNNIQEKKYNDLLQILDKKINSFNFSDKQYLLLLKAIVLERAKKYKEAIQIYELQKKYIYYAKKRIEIISKYYIKENKNNIINNKNNSNIVNNVDNNNNDNKNNDYNILTNNINNDNNYNKRINENKAENLNNVNVLRNEQKPYKILDNKIIEFINDNDINQILKYDFLTFLKDPVTYFILHNATLNDRKKEKIKNYRSIISNYIFDKNGNLLLDEYSSSQLSKYLFYFGIFSFLLGENDYLIYFIDSFIYGNFYYYSIFSAIIVNNVIAEVTEKYDEYYNGYKEDTKTNNIKSYINSILLSFSNEDIVYIKKILFFNFVLDKKGYITVNFDPEKNNSNTNTTINNNSNSKIDTNTKNNNKTDYSKNFYLNNFNYKKFYKLALFEAKINKDKKEQIKEYVDLLKKFKEISLDIEYLRVLFYLKDGSLQKDLYNKALTNYYYATKDYAKAIVYSNKILSYTLKLINPDEDKSLFNFKDIIKNNDKNSSAYFNKFFKLIYVILKEKENNKNFDKDTKNKKEINIEKNSTKITSLNKLKKIVNNKAFYKFYNFLFISYPFTYIELIDSNISKSSSLDKYLLLSLIRVESHFNPYSVSIDGARGLTQILPDTASWIFYKNLKHSEQFKKKLFEPEIAIQGAIKYLTFLDEKFNSLFLSLASYNAGYNRIKRNINDEYYKNDDIKTISIFYLIETLKIPETNLFLKKITRNYMLYKYLYDNESLLSIFSGIENNWK